jgi:lipoprotein-anchoring transpeptidase ErfK/SrfK
MLARIGACLTVVAIAAVAFHVSTLVARPTALPKMQPAVASRPVALASATPPAPKPALTAAVASAADAFVVKRILDVPTPFRHGDYVWDDKGVPDGPILITVDLTAQTISIFRGGYEIGAAVILYGANDKPTPLGTFPISQKDADHWSTLYDAPMPYMLRLTADGVAIHGSTVAYGGATHGCIGVPTAFAKLLFAQAKLGDPVVVTDGKMMDVGGARTNKS